MTIEQQIAKNTQRIRELTEMNIQLELSLGRGIENTSSDDVFGEIIPRKGVTTA